MCYCQLSRPWKFARTTSKQVKCLTKDTEHSLVETFNSLGESSAHFLSTIHQYIMLGNFATNPVEKKLAKLRQRDGETYFISAQWFLEKMNSIKQHFLKTRWENLSSRKFEIKIFLYKMCFFNQWIYCNVLENLQEFKTLVSIDAKAALVYVAGHVCPNDLVVRGTFFYYDKFEDFSRDNNLDSLRKPADTTCCVLFTTTCSFVLTSPLRVGL